MTFIAADAFNNPDSPVYYIVGVVFLLLIFGALAAYLLISKHLEKKKNAAKENLSDEESKQNSVDADTASNDAAPSAEEESAERENRNAQE